MLRRSIALALITAGPVLVGACGTKVIDNGKAESLISNSLIKEGVPKNQIKSVSCPSGLGIKKGATFDCTAALTTGAKATITFTQEDNNGFIKVTNVRQTQ